MGVINGKKFIERIDSLNTEVWYDGQRIEGRISEHPAFKGLVQSKAALYDLQNDQKMIEEMTFRSRETNELAGLSYLTPKTKEDVKKRRKMMQCWAHYSCGVMGRSPDYMNSALMSFASSSSILKGRENCFPENIKALYERAMKEDLSFTHTLIPPQVNRSQGYFEISHEPIAARVVDRTDEGIVIKGARLLATQGGVTDEIFVYSSPGILDPDEAFAFAIPSDTKGVKFICRESFVGGDSVFDHPLSSRFEEMDTILVFDNVLVPWERVFFYDNVDAARDFMNKTSFQNHAIHQVVTRQIVKTEFILGLAELLVETINVSEYQHIQEKMSEIIIGLETMKALAEKAENDAQLDEWGNMLPSIIPLQTANLIFPKIYPRFSEIIQLIGASGMLALPTEKDFKSDIRPELNQYLQAATMPAEDRVKIFRLAWDLTMSSFGTRQTHYERYFFGDPVRLSGTFYKNYPKDELVHRVKNL